MNYFLEAWHDFEDLMPDENTDIWFTLKDNENELFVGVFDEEAWVVMADHGSYPGEAIKNWRYVMEAPMKRYPEDGEIVGAELTDPNIQGLVTGIFFEDYYDETKDEFVGPALALNDIYDADEFQDANFEGAIEASNVACFIEVPDLA